MVESICLFLCRHNSPVSSVSIPRPDYGLEAISDERVVLLAKFRTPCGTVEWKDVGVDGVGTPGVETRPDQGHLHPVVVHPVGTGLEESGRCRSQCARSGMTGYGRSSLAGGLWVPCTEGDGTTGADLDPKSRNRTPTRPRLSTDSTRAGHVTFCAWTQGGETDDYGRRGWRSRSSVFP